MAAPVASTPATEPAQIRAPKRRSAFARLLEYVAAGGAYWYARALTALPHPIDDVTLDYGDDLYDRMCHDAQIASLVNLIKAGTLGNGLTFSASVPPEHEDYPAAQELADWCTWVFDRLQTPIDEVLWDMFDAFAYGNRVAELVYGYGPGPDGKTRLLLQAIKPKPRRMTAFVVDAFNNVLGCVGLLPGKSFLVQSGMQIDPNNLPDNFLDRAHFAILTFRMRNNDPRGQSALRPAYDAWYQKQQIKIEYLHFLDRFATPITIGYTAPGAESVPTLDAAGNPTVASSPEDEMADDLATLRNSSTAAFPNGAKVELHQVTGEGEAHLAGIALQNQEMAKAITSQTLASEEGQHQSRAASKTHQDTLETIVRQCKLLVVRMLLRDILLPLVTSNFGEKAASIAPEISLGSAEQHDFAIIATAVAALMTSGFLHESQLPFLDLRMNLPVRDLSDDEEAAETPAEEAAEPPAEQQQEQREGDEMPMQPGQKMPMEPERQAARIIDRTTWLAHAQHAQERARHTRPITDWRGEHLRAWLERSA